jgi:hypothetical protein
MKKLSTAWDKETQPALRIERFWSDGRIEAFDFQGLPSSIEIPNAASTVVSVLDPSIDIRSVDGLLVIDEDEAPNFEEFFMENLPADHALQNVPLEAEWEGLDVEVKPGVVVPSPYAVGIQDDVPYVVVAIARNPDASTGEPSKLPLLVRENSEGDFSALLGPATPWVHHSWFSDPSDGMTSWEGGSSCAYLGRGMWATLMWGDLDNTISISRLSDADDQTITEQLQSWVSDQNLDTWIALSFGIASADPKAFTSDEWAELKKSLEQLAKRNITVDVNVPEGFVLPLNEAVNSSVNGLTIHEFLSNPDFPFRSQMLTMVQDAAHNSSPAALLDADNLEAWLSDPENLRL